MFFFVTAALAASPCPESPELRDPDNVLTLLEQNLKFITTGTRRPERAALLKGYLEGDGASVDLLLLSEARITHSLQGWPDWCFYAQAGEGLGVGYHWAPIEEGRSPGGLALGVRQHEAGKSRILGLAAGRRFRARPVTFAEGFLGRLFRYRKGWATLVVDGTQLIWSHTQASYRAQPDRGAGAEGRGRAGQFDDLAVDVGRPAEATLITGDLNLLAGYTPHCTADEPRVCRARDIDTATVTKFREHTGLDLDWYSTGKTYAGSFRKGKWTDPWDLDAPYDRVGVNEAFLQEHPGAAVEPVEIGDATLRVSDHLGLLITIPFGPFPASPEREPPLPPGGREAPAAPAG